MREIKFRFWTPDKLMIDDHAGWVADIGINEALKCSRECGYVAMQFAGIKDNNGKEIFDGDIISVHEKNANFPLIYIVVFNESECGFRIRWIGHYKEKKKLGFYDLKISGDGRKEFKIIGNIYENPELLTT